MTSALQRYHNGEPISSLTILWGAPDGTTTRIKRLLSPQELATYHADAVKLTRTQRDPDLNPRVAEILVLLAERWSKLTEPAALVSSDQVWNLADLILIYPCAEETR